MSLSVVIPSRNVSNLIICVRTVQREEPHARIIVVDDGLGISSDEWLWKDSGVMFVPGQKPFIFARNCNLGMEFAQPDDVVLLNDDALLGTSWGFTILQKSAEKFPEYGIIGAVTNVTGQVAQLPGKLGLREVDHFAFVCVLIPRRTIEQVGYLDERYALDYGCEDRDYCEACKRAGLKVAVHDHCFVDHGSLVSTFRGHPHNSRSYARNHQLLVQKWGTLD